MSAATWPLDDARAIAAKLNEDGESYSELGIDFAGWSVVGEPFLAPEPTVSPRAAFGRVGLGRPSTIQASGDHLGAPGRALSPACLELHFAGAADASVYTAIYDDVLGKLYNSPPERMHFTPATWSPPREADIRSTETEFPGFMPVRGDILYTSGKR